MEERLKRAILSYEKFHGIEQEFKEPYPIKISYCQVKTSPYEQLHDIIEKSKESDHVKKAMKHKLYKQESLDMFYQCYHHLQQIKNHASVNNDIVQGLVKVASEAVDVAHDTMSNITNFSERYEKNADFFLARVANHVSPEDCRKKYEDDKRIYLEIVEDMATLELDTQGERDDRDSVVQAFKDLANTCSDYLLKNPSYRAYVEFKLPRQIRRDNSWYFEAGEIKPTFINSRVEYTRLPARQA